MPGVRACLKATGFDNGFEGGAQAEDLFVFFDEHGEEGDFEGEGAAEGNHLANMGNAYEKPGNVNEACELWKQALEIYDEI